MVSMTNPLFVMPRENTDILTRVPKSQIFWRAAS